jgi:endonuclease III
MNRIGVVSTKTPEQTDKMIDSIFDEKTKKQLHHPVVLFGRYHCIARKPKCETCPIKKYCNYYEKSVSDSVLKAYKT